jgi:hypothetical protein
MSCCLCGGLGNNKIKLTIGTSQMEDLILLFTRVACHLKCYESANETTTTMHGFILAKFYFALLVVYGME